MLFSSFCQGNETLVFRKDEVMEMIGNWKRESNKKYLKQVQAHIGILVCEVEKYADKRGVTTSKILREIWGWALRSKLKLGPAKLERFPSGREGLVGVSVTLEMFEEIESTRGDVPRGTFLRALTAAGLEAGKEDHDG